jgi:hypothetical protein
LLPNCIRKLLHEMRLGSMFWQIAKFSTPCSGLSL